MLKAEEEISLACQWRDHKDESAAQALVTSHLKLVVSTARIYIGYGLPYADLIQEGAKGLMRAAQKFDPERGVRLCSYALPWIKADIHEYILRNWRIVKVATTKAQRKLFFNLRGMRTPGQSLNSAEARRIATTLDVKPSEVFEMNMRIHSREIPMDGHADDANSQAAAPINYLACEPSSDPALAYESEQTARLRLNELTQSLELLDQRSRDIVTRRWLSNPENQPTLHELASEYGVSAERIRQIESKALKLMKTAISK